MTTTDVDNWPGGHHGLQGPELMTQLREHSERLGVTGVLDQIEAVDLRTRPFQPSRRLPGLHVRRADHRHGGIGPLPRPALRAELSRQGRVGLRHLRRLLLPGPARRRDRRRQHRRRGSAVPVQPRVPRHADPPPGKLRAEKMLQDKLLARTRDGGNVSVVWNHEVEAVLGTEPASPACASGPRTVAGRHDLDVTGLFIAIGHDPNTAPVQGSARTGQGLCGGAHGPRRRRNGNQRPGRVRGGRRGRQRVPAGDHLRGLGLHGGARCGEVSGQRCRVKPGRRAPCALKSPGAWPRCPPPTGTVCAAPRVPFLRHEFLLALEETGCVGAGYRLDPCHLLLREDCRPLLGAMPLYSKTSSYGEFVFDWAWADAYRRAGLRYFPKLVSAVPFTPATSPRLLQARTRSPTPRQRRCSAARPNWPGRSRPRRCTCSFRPPVNPPC